MSARAMVEAIEFSDMDTVRALLDQFDIRTRVLGHTPATWCIFCGAPDILELFFAHYDIRHFDMNRLFKDAAFAFSKNNIRVDDTFDTDQEMLIYAATKIREVADRSMLELI